MGSFSVPWCWAGVRRGTFMPSCLQKAFLLAEPCPGSREHWPEWGQEVAPPVPLSSDGLLSERGPCSSVMNVVVVPTCPELETCFFNTFKRV